MNKKQTTKVIALRSLIAIFCIGFGILISAQFRSLPTRVLNPIAPYASLKETKNELYSEQDELKDQITTLQESVRQVQKEKESTILSKDEIEILAEQKTIAGLTRLNGPGVIVILDDSKIANASEQSIVHAADLRDVIGLLWASGAEGIEINGQRIVLSSAVDCIVNTILVNNVRITTPFHIEATGDQNKMFVNLKDKTRLNDLWNRVSVEGVVLSIEKNSDITLPAYNGYFSINSNAS